MTNSNTEPQITTTSQHKMVCIYRTCIKELLALTRKVSQVTAQSSLSDILPARCKDAGQVTADGLMAYPSSLHRSHWVKTCRTSLGRRGGNQNASDIKTHLTYSSSLSHVVAFNHARKGGWKENGCPLHFHIAFYSNEGIRRQHASHMGRLKENNGSLNNPHPRKNRLSQVGNRLPLNQILATVIRWAIIHCGLGSNLRTMQQ